ncbi:MAG: hypothetical protein U0Q12_14640 [Vicinamibacterales bacterium]
MPHGSMLLRVGFVGLTGVLALGFVTAVFWAAARSGRSPMAVRHVTSWAAMGAALWIAATGGAAAAGLLRFSPFPPTMALLFAAIGLGAIGLGVSPLGRLLSRALPLSVLVGSQAFRVVVELLMHRAYEEGLMPVQMSYAGYNWDILSGVSAAVLGMILAIRRLPRWVVATWNVMGLLLLVNVLTIAMLSAPTPLRLFHNEPANVWITAMPWVWLPAVMVFGALLGHVLVFRRLRASRLNELRPPCCQTDPGDGSTVPVVKRDR